jgi:hypothetical protein
MSPLILYNGALLMVDGALAGSEDCCCSECCFCPVGSIRSRPSSDITSSLIDDYQCSPNVWTPAYPECNPDGDPPYTDWDIPDLPDPGEALPCPAEGAEGCVNSVSASFINTVGSMYIYGLLTDISEFYPVYGWNVYLVDTAALNALIDDECQLFVEESYMSWRNQEFSEYASDCGCYAFNGTNTVYSTVRILQVTPDDCNATEAVSATVNDVTSVIVTGVYTQPSIPQLNAETWEATTEPRGGKWISEQMVWQSGCTPIVSISGTIEGAPAPVYQQPPFVERIWACTDGSCPPLP